MDSHLFYGKRRHLVAVIPEDGDDSDDGLADDGDADDDPDFIASINEDDSDDTVSDLSNDDEQIPSGSTVQPLTKKRKVKTPQAYANKLRKAVKGAMLSVPKRGFRFQVH